MSALYFLLGLLVGGALTWFYIKKLKPWLPERG